MPIEETVGAIAEMIQAGYVRYIGSREVGPETIRRAAGRASHRRPADRIFAHQPQPRGKIFPVLDELGIGVTAYGVLSRGLLSASQPAGTGDFRTHLPRFSGDNLDRNQQLVARLKEIADDKRHHAASAWPLPGCWPSGSASCRSWERAPGLRLLRASAHLM